ncbi:MAG: Nif3-like dinuclear metal center hexameric protein [Syntrophobacteraceae bacterium]
MFRQEHPSSFIFGAFSMVRVKEILGWIDSLAPFRFAESWDNCGLQVGNPQASITGLLVALDPSSPVLAEARERGCQCVVTHHPLLLHPLSSILTDSWPGCVVERALLSGISIIAAHTNLDAARQGTNGQLAQLLGLSITGPLDAQPSLCQDSRYGGMGVVGLLAREATAEKIAAELKSALGAQSVRIAGDWKKRVSRVAVCSGSGGSLLGKALAAGADLYITGDLKYHDARLAEEYGLVVIDIGHFASEKPVLGVLCDFFRARAASEALELDVFVSQSEFDPLRSVS